MRLVGLSAVLALGVLLGVCGAVSWAAYGLARHID